MVQDIYHCVVLYGQFVQQIVIVQPLNIFVWHVWNSQPFVSSIFHFFHTQPFVMPSSGIRYSHWFLVQPFFFSAVIVEDPSAILYSKPYISNSISRGSILYHEFRTFTRFSAIAFTQP